MNPNQIGISIVEENKVIFTQQYNLYDLTQIMQEEHNSSKSIRFKHLNNKLKHEILEISKQISNIATYYKVKAVFIENLNNIGKDKANLGKTFNRKVHCFWKRDLFINNLSKRCALNNISFYKIYPQYSSLIGNLCNDFTDPINASLEINRRGNENFLGKNKSKFYPELTKEVLKDQWKEYLSMDVKSWKELSAKISGLRYRVSLEEVKRSYKVFKMSSYKSKVAVYNFI
jgi:hypothetical protein